MIIVDIDMPNSCSECPMFDIHMGYCTAATFGCPDRLIKDASIRQSSCPIVGKARDENVNAYLDLTGRRFGMLTVIGRCDEDDAKTYRSKRHARWQCKCDCGKVVIRETNHLIRNKYPAYSCGCTRRKYKEESK